MKLISCCLSWVVLVVVCGPAQAQTGFDGQAQADAIAAFVDEQTIGVAHVDLSRVDLDQLLKQAAELTPGGERILAPVVEHFRPMAKHLLDSGIKDVYALVSLADLPQPPFLVFLTPPGADTTSLERWHGELHVEAIERVGKAVFAGSKRCCGGLSLSRRRSGPRSRERLQPQATRRRKCCCCRRPTTAA